MQNLQYQYLHGVTGTKAPLPSSYTPAARLEWKNSPSSPLPPHALVHRGNAAMPTSSSEADLSSATGSDHVRASLLLCALWDDKWFGIDPSSRALFEVQTGAAMDRDASCDDYCSHGWRPWMAFAGPEGDPQPTQAAPSGQVDRSSAGMNRSTSDPAIVAPRPCIAPYAPTVLSSPPVPLSPPMPSLERPPEKPPLLRLGTWAKRQVWHGDHVSPPIEDKEVVVGAPGGAREEAAVLSRSGSNVTRGLRELQAAKEAAMAAHAAAQGDDDVAGAAWRWRFARRWNAEQTREVDPNEKDAAADKTEEALQLLQAGAGVGWNMQMMGRTSSDAAGSLKASCMNGSLVGLDTSMLSEESDPGWSSNTHAGMEATRELSSLYRHAERLATQRQELQAAANLRWQTVAGKHGSESAGGPNQSVDVDDHGTFCFVVMRVCDQAGRQRVVVHGHNDMAEEAIVERARRKIQQLTGHRGMNADALVVLGGGIMEWTPGTLARSKRVRMHSAHSTENGALVSATSNPSDVLNLAAVLVRQSFPASYVVSMG